MRQIVLLSVLGFGIAIANAVGAADSTSVGPPSVTPGSELQNQPDMGHPLPPGCMDMESSGSSVVRAEGQRTQTSDGREWVCKRNADGVPQWVLLR